MGEQFKIKNRKKVDFKLPRQARNARIASILHIIVQGINKEYIFNKEKYIKKYLELLKTKNEEEKIYIIAYCIMNNHAHILIYSEKTEELSKFMQKVNTAFAKYYNKNEDRVGYVFRDRYFCEQIENEKHFIMCINYIHNNPIKAQMVSKCEDYKYSSYNEFLKNDKIKEIKKVTKLNYYFNIKTEGKFLDVEQQDNMQIIKNAIEEFVMEKNIKPMEIYEKRKILKDLISFLKNQYSIKYTDIMKELEIPRGVMQNLRK